ncbi:MAG TPA: hypothetical protein EYP06_04540 [Desulfobacterales bacterium]|nr:hypothetical protein [Desulfobacterales bacterium]
MGKNIFKTLVMLLGISLLLIVVNICSATAASFVAEMVVEMKGKKTISPFFFKDSAYRFDTTQDGVPCYFIVRKEDPLMSIVVPKKKGYTRLPKEASIFMEAILKAIKDFPMVNVSVDGINIIKRKDINLGMATALPSGNLIVPVIKKADQYSLIGLTKQVNSLVRKARNNNLKPDDIAGGTYTVTNVGTFGNIMGTPIISQPQVAILAVGIIRKKPVVLETPNGDVIAIRHMMYLSHAYDHRVVDGALGGKFVKRVAEYLEKFELNREF